MRTTVKVLLVAVLAVHGLIHVMGTVKGFGWADIAALKQSISQTLAALWLLASVLVLATAVLLALSVNWWWIVGAVAVVVSQAVIITSWSDAKFGTIANVILLVAVVYAAVTRESEGLGAAALP